MERSAKAVRICRWIKWGALAAAVFILAAALQYMKHRHAPVPVVTTQTAAPVKPAKRKKAGERYMRAAVPQPYSCATVRWAVATFPREWLEAQAKKRGITPAQRRAAARCLRKR
jgi:hypothetical protein